LTITGAGHNARAQLNTSAAVSAENGTWVYVEQAGSLVIPILRFDFTHFSAVTASEIKK
jgi:hypothetical protein